MSGLGSGLPMTETLRPPRAASLLLRLFASDPDFRFFFVWLHAELVSAPRAAGLQALRLLLFVWNTLWIAGSFWIGSFAASRRRRRQVAA